ncbi:hypothetical protein D6745_01020 [Candidatus Woesearchaeota archaeon]|nr:MAG: hypothetical protein D6745_01020 [Candidatus Woesearchaeota archaeon]
MLIFRKKRVFDQSAKDKIVEIEEKLQDIEKKSFDELESKHFILSQEILRQLTPFIDVMMPSSRSRTFDYKDRDFIISILGYRKEGSEWNSIFEKHKKIVYTIRQGNYVEAYNLIKNAVSDLKKRIAKKERAEANAYRRINKIIKKYNPAQVSMRYYKSADPVKYGRLLAEAETTRAKITSMLETKKLESDHLIAQLLTEISQLREEIKAL